MIFNTSEIVPNITMRFKCSVSCFLLNNWNPLNVLISNIKSFLCYYIFRAVINFLQCIFDPLNITLYLYHLFRAFLLYFLNFKFSFIYRSRYSILYLDNRKSFPSRSHTCNKRFYFIFHFSNQLFYLLSDDLNINFNSIIHFLNQILQRFSL